MIFCAVDLLRPIDAKYYGEILFSGSPTASIGS